MEFRSNAYVAFGLLPNLYAVAGGKGVTSRKDVEYATGKAFTATSSKAASSNTKAGLQHSSIAQIGTGNSKGSNASPAKSRKVVPTVPCQIPARTKPVKTVPSPPQLLELQYAKDTQRACTQGQEGKEASSSHPAYSVGQVLQKVKSLLQPSTTTEHQFYAACYSVCRNARDSVSHLCEVPSVALHVAAHLQYPGCQTVVRKVLDSKQYWSRSMVNIFIFCVLPGANGRPAGYVVDPNFKEHFRTAHMTDRYRDIWECLPPIFVGPPAQMVPLLQLLCYEVTLSFEALGRQLPPWRSYGATVGRWLSKSFNDVSVPAAAAVGAVAAAAAAADGTKVSAPREVQAFLQRCQQLQSMVAAPTPSRVQPAVAAPLAVAATAFNTNKVVLTGFQAACHHANGQQQLRPSTSSEIQADPVAMPSSTDPAAHACGWQHAGGSQCSTTSRPQAPEAPTAVVSSSAARASTGAGPGQEAQKGSAPGAASTGADVGRSGVGMRKTSLLSAKLAAAACAPAAGRPPPALSAAGEVGAGPLVSGVAAAPMAPAKVS